MTNSNSKSLNYSQAGVSIDEGNEFVEKIKPLIKKTKTSSSLMGLGGFAGLFQLDLAQFSEPILVACTDGVGTKLKLAIEMDHLEPVGVDAVAMCVNDMICCGAKPLFFLDYFATSKLNTDQAVSVVKGMTDALASINCELLGGETAEMPGMYQPGDFDIAGFSVGAVNKSQIIDGSQISKGDVIIGLPSSGVHSNGFSLVRKIIDTQKVDISNDKFDFEKPIGEVLLAPTALYVNPILKLIDKFDIKGMAHITGGGLIENLPRIFDSSLQAQIEKSQIEIPSIFNWIQGMGNVEEEEMFRVFNMGIGFTLFCQKTEADQILSSLKEMNIEGKIIGEISTRDPSDSGVKFVS